MRFDLTEAVHASRDPGDKVQTLEHLVQPFVATTTEAEARAADEAGLISAPAFTPRELADQYLRAVAPHYNIDEKTLLSTGSAREAQLAGGAAPDQYGKDALVVAEEKELMGTTTVSYQQTHAGLPVWGAGVSVTVQSNPLRVTSSQSSVHSGLSLAHAGVIDRVYERATSLTPTALQQILGTGGQSAPVINSTRQLVYQYEPEERIDPEARVPRADVLSTAPPTLQLPAVPPGIVAGEHYVVTEVLFTMPVEGFGSVNWRAFVEPDTNAVLYLRAFVACAVPVLGENETLTEGTEMSLQPVLTPATPPAQLTPPIIPFPPLVHPSGLVFTADPKTQKGATAPEANAGAAALDPFRSRVLLRGLHIPLDGEFVRLEDREPPVVAEPPVTQDPPGAFDYSAPTRQFAAANSYYHVDWFFRLIQGMGFNLASYFDGTQFPVRVDPCAFNDAMNARAPGNTTGTGSDGFLFGLAGSAGSASIAADLRVVLHEFGHALLWDSVHSPNFGFAHSAGDSVGAILLDPESALRNDPAQRFVTFPWVNIGRSHGRDVAAGWGWGGVNDLGGYNSEQILSTTLFRLYRSLGGDSTDVERRKLAARQAVYLIVRSIGSLAANPVTPTPNPGIYATALMNADIGTLNFEGYRGGTFHKVVRWSFEKQGLYQLAGVPKPVVSAGAPPAVDVYIDDGRKGEYQFQPVHWECMDIWNRRAADGATAHQLPIVGKTNFAYVRVHNRGTQAASNIVVRGYSADPGAGLTWPADYKPMTTPFIKLAGSLAPNGNVVVGPFQWTPKVVGHECMLMAVSATGDPSNIDPTTFFPCAVGPTPDWRLVPYDNNIGQRNVVPVPGGGGVTVLASALGQHSVLVRNPFNRQVNVEVKAELSPFLSRRKFQLRVDAKPTASFALAPNGTRRLSLGAERGAEFTRQELLAESDGAQVRLMAYVDGLLVGGMTYRLDPDLGGGAPDLTGPEPQRPELPATGTPESEAKSTLLQWIEKSSTPGSQVTTASVFTPVPGSAPATVTRATIKKMLIEIEISE